MISVEETPFQMARQLIAQGRHAFILQRGHLTATDNRTSTRVITEPYQYGITFIPELYIRNHWSQWFNVVDYRQGAIHNFQDIIVLTPKKQILLQIKKWAEVVVAQYHSINIRA
jgi:hypothetical protein